MRTRDEALHVRRKSEIVAAAAKCFAAKGIHQTNMQEICKEAQISAGALYRYFDSKNAIVFAIADNEKMANAELIEHLLNCDDVVKGLCQATPEIIDALCNEQFGRLSIEIGAEATRNPEVAKIFAKNEDELRLALIKSIKQGQKRGYVDLKVHVEGAVFMILALFDGIAGRAAFSQSLPHKRLKKSMNDLFIRLLRGKN